MIGDFLCCKTLWIHLLLPLLPSLIAGRHLRQPSTPFLKAAPKSFGLSDTTTSCTSEFLFSLRGDPFKVYDPRLPLFLLNRFLSDLDFSPCTE